MKKIQELDKDFIIRSLTDRQIQDIEIDYFFKWFIEKNPSKQLKDCIRKFSNILQGNRVVMSERRLLSRYYDLKNKGLVKSQWRL